MAKQKADLIIHPARLQILATLGEQPLTIQEIAGRLPEIPKSSIYRHIRALLDGGYVQISDTRSVKGTQEMVYTVRQVPHLSQADMAGLSREECLHYFILFMVAQVQEFSRYLFASPDLDFETDRAGYSMAVMNLTSEERDQMLMTIQQAVKVVAGHPPGAGRRPHKLAVITHPFATGDEHATD